MSLASDAETGTGLLFEPWIVGSPVIFLSTCCSSGLGVLLPGSLSRCRLLSIHIWVGMCGKNILSSFQGNDAQAAEWSLQQVVGSIPMSDVSLSKTLKPETAPASSEGA